LTENYKNLIRKKVKLTKWPSKDENMTKPGTGIHHFDTWKIIQLCTQFALWL
jgi:hypothetical protein